MSDHLSLFLADTWWFALTERLSDDSFIALARLRVSQGFTAVQLVVGIPPEVGLENRSAQSPFGVAWNLDGLPNFDYLKFARTRIQQLNKIGLSVIVYGAWGYQIEWIGVEGMIRWWQAIINTIDDLDVAYCLTGESNLWAGHGTNLLPDKTSTDLTPSRIKLLVKRFPDFFAGRLMEKVRPVLHPFQQKHLNQRIFQWSELLRTIRPLTNRPFLIHTLPGEISEDVVENAELLTAVTVQTGHKSNSKNSLWQLPAKLKLQYHKPFVNLEPWYEGVLGQFHQTEQLYAYWVSMLAGADAYCYGAHGVWNVGDGHFLAQWGEQTFADAIGLDTPRIIGLSHNIFQKFSPAHGIFDYSMDGENLIYARRSQEDHAIIFYPNMAQITLPIPIYNKLWLPEQGVFTDLLPQSGAIVLIKLSSKKNT